MARRIYLDAPATTQVEPEVLAAMLPFVNSFYDNPAGGQHIFGRGTAQAVGHIPVDVKWWSASARSTPAN